MTDQENSVVLRKSKVDIDAESQENESDRRLSTMVVASMAVQKLQNDQKKHQDMKNSITIMRKDSQKVDLHTASEKDEYDKVKMLLEKKLNPNEKNILSKTPLHLACKSVSPRIISLLIDYGADVDAQDSTSMTPLHHLLLTSGKDQEDVEKVAECIHVLIKHKANVNVPNYAGTTALHLAAMRAEGTWVDALIAAGADLNAKNNEGVSVLYFIMKHCPNSLIKCLDNCVNQGNNRRMTRHDKGFSAQSSGFEVRLDFNTLDLRKHYRKETDSRNKKRKLGDIENTTDPTIFFSQVLAIKQNNDPSLSSIIEDIFLHPVAQTYFYLKWSEIKYLYYFAVLLTHFIYSLTFSTYAVLVYRTICDPSSLIQNTSTFNTSFTCSFNCTCNSPIAEDTAILAWVLLIIFTIVFICREASKCYHDWRQYVSKPKNVLPIFLIGSFFLISFHSSPFDGDIELYRYQYEVATFGVFATWLHMTILMQNMPKFGLYIEMLGKVTKTFIKFVLAYVCLFIAFAISFYILFPSYPAFHSYIPFAFIKTLVMMIGELEYDDVMYPQGDNGETQLQYYPVSAYSLMFAFIVLFSIIIMNLLFGLAVSDVQELQRVAQLHQFMQQVETITETEKIMTDYFPSRMRRLLLRYIPSIENLRNNMNNIKSIQLPDPNDRSLPETLKRIILDWCLMKQSGHETDSQKIDRLSAQLQTMQNILQELLYEKQGKKSCCITQEKKPVSNFFNRKGDKNKDLNNKSTSDAGRGIKSALGVATVVGGGASFGGLGNHRGRLKDISESKDSPA